ncbi:MAG: LamG-like jellyroll fold domain-containing protein [Bacteroidota bacterium]
MKKIFTFFTACLLFAVLSVTKLSAQANYAQSFGGSNDYVATGNDVAFAFTGARSTPYKLSSPAPLVAPTITCPGNINTNNAPGSCTKTVAYSATSTGSPTITYAFIGATIGSGNGTGSGQNFNVGATTVTLTATNTSGTATCSFVVTVTDNQSPVITCQPNMTVNVTPGRCDAVVAVTSPSVSDNCSQLQTGNALNFDGVDDIAFVNASSVINTANQTARTVEIYFKVADKNISSKKQVIWEEGGTQNGLNLYVYNGELYMGIYSASQSWSPMGNWIHTPNIQSGQWHNAVLVFDGNAANINDRLKGYLDGQLFGSSSTGGTTLNLHTGANAVGALSNAGVFHDGVDNSNTSSFFGGDIDEIRLWTVARTAAQLAATNTTKLLGTETGLVVYYDFDQGTACGNNSAITILQDRTSTGLNGTLQGFNLGGSTCFSNFTNGSPALTSDLSLTNNKTGTSDASGTYPVGVTTLIWTAKDLTGNTSTCTQTITVINNNVATITAGGPTTFCTGGSVTLTASSGSSYLWSTGATAQAITTSVAGSFTVSVTNAFGCSGISSPTVVTVNAVPTIGSVSGITTICSNATTQLSVASASGGTISFAGGYEIHTFTNGGTFTPFFTGNVEVLVVAGGGSGGGTSGPTSGGHYQGGGGGAGGVLQSNSYAVSLSNGVPVTVGAGGSSIITGNGANGQNSVFGTLAAIGGGGGGQYNAVGNTGGSGGGNGRDNNATPAQGTAGQGNAGGNGDSGGGGGAGAAANTYNGGAGISSSISGVATFYAGGGGGSTTNTPGGAGGVGGGGAGANSFVYHTSGTSGTPNTGGGGGAAGVGLPTGAGGSGIVIVRFLAPVTTTWSSSNTNTATILNSGLLSAVAAGTTNVTATATNAAGCFTNVSATITVNPLPTAGISGTTAVCLNASSPSITFTGANATAPYTFTYTINGGAQQTVTSSGNTATVSVPTGVAGTFIYALVSVKDASSTICIANASGSATVTVNPLPTATISGTTTVCQNATLPTITFTGANATAPYTFTYTINGVAQPTVTSSGNTATVTAPTGTAGPFVYALVSVKDASSTLCSKTVTGSATVTVNALPTIAVSPSAPTITNGGSVSLTASGASTYTWSPATGLSAATGVTVTANPIITTSYTVTGTNANSCVNTGNVTVSVTQVPATALNFDGTNDYISLGSSSLLKPTTALTVESWVYNADWSVSRLASIIGNTESGGYGIDISDLTGSSTGTYINAAVRRNGVYAILTFQASGLSAGWHHLALTYDGTKTTLYVDGVQKAQNNAGAVYPIQYHATNSTLIGAEASSGDNAAAGSYFQGSLDEVKVWSRALCAEELLNNMGGEIASPQTGLVAYYKFNQGFVNADNTSILTLTDVSGNNLTGAIRNFTRSGITSNWVAGNVTGNATAYVTATAAITGTPSVCVNATTALANSIAGGTWTSSNQSAATVNSSGVVSGLTAGTTVITYTTLCGGVSTVTVTVNALPTVAAITGTADVCAGATTQLNDATGSGVWSSTNTAAATINASGLVTGVANGTSLIIYTVTNAGSCVVSASMTVTVNALPIVAITPSSAIVCAGISVTLAANSGGGNAMHFNGTNSYVDLGAGVVLPQTFTEEAWIYSGSGNDGLYHGFLGYQPGTNTRPPSLWIHNGTAIHGGFATGGTFYYYVTGSVIVQNTWNHIAQSYDGTTLRVYVNGVEITTLPTNFQPPLNSIPSSVGIKNIGRVDNYFNGDIDEVRLWNVTRTPAQIKYDMNKSVAPDTAGLVGYYKFSENAGSTTTADATSGGRTGTLTNGPTFVVSSAPVGATITWSPSAGLNTTLGAIAIATPSATTTYIATATDPVTGCVSTASSVVTVNPLPTATISGATDVCINTASPSVTFTGANGTAPYTFTYSINSVVQPPVTSSGNTATVTAPTGAAGTFTYALVSVKDASATLCSNTATGSVVVVVRAVTTISSITGTTTICSGNSTTLTAASTFAGPVFKWYDAASGGNLLFTGAAYTTPALTNTTTYYVEVTSTPFVCAPAARTAVTVTVNPLPTATVSGTTGVCLNATSPTITFTGGNATAPYTFTYTINGVTQTVTSSGNTATVNAPTGTAGTFVYALVSVKDASGTLCTANASGSATVTVNALPVPVITASGPTTFCANSSVTLSVQGGSAGNALTFGSGKYVDVPNNSSLNVGTSTDFTYEAWVKLNGNQGNYAGIVIKGTGGPFAQLVIVNNHIAAEIFSTSMVGVGNGLEGTTNLNDNTWHHLAMVVSRASNNCKLYVDGSQEANVTNTLISGNLDNTSSMLIGVERTKGIYFNGSIDEVRIWNAARTQAQIQAAKGSSVPVNSTGLVAYYKLDEGSGVVTADATANAHSGSLINSPVWLVPSTAPVSGFTNFSWSNGAVTSAITPASSGNYTVTVTDLFGCVNTSAATAVTINPLPSATIAGTTTICQNGTAPTITFTGSNATSPYTFTYTINGGVPQTATSSGNTATVTALTGTAGTFVYALVSVKDASSTLCTATASGSATVTVNALPTATISGTTTVCQNAATPTITFTGANATSPYTFTYTINNGATQTVTSSGNTATVTVPTGTAGTFTYALVSVKDASATLCTNSASGSATVTVNTLPTFTSCPSNQNINATTGLCTAPVSYTATASGTPSPTLTYVFSGATTGSGSGTGSGQTFNKGVTTVTIIATNSCGTATCSFTITVTDNQAPVFVGSVSGSGVPAGILANVPEASQFQMVYKLPIPNSSNWDQGSVIPYSVNNAASLASASFNRIAYYLELDSKWVWVSMDKFTSNVALTGIPTGTTIFQQKVNNLNVLSSVGAGVVNGNNITTGNIELWGYCYTQGNSISIPGASASVYDFGDAINGNIDCYGSFQVHNYGASQTVFAYNAWSTVNIADIGIGNNTGNANPDWTFMANAGSITTKNLYVFITGGIQSITVNADAGQCSAIVNVTTPQATDNCGTPTVTGIRSDNLAISAAYPKGVTTITWTATDASGNTSTANQTITVIDNQPPTISCIGNISVTATSAAGAVVTYAAPVGTDNCSGATTVRTTGPASGTTFPIGTTTVTHTVTDGAGLTAQCSFTVTVSGLAPVITCPANISVIAATGQCGTNVSFAATETTGIPASTKSYTENGNPVSSGSFFSVGTHTIFATAVNAVGTSTCNFTITVLDTQFPVLMGVPANITVECNAVPGAATVTATDNCSTSIPSFTEVRTNGNCPGRYTLTRTWSTTDASGNTTIRTQLIQVQDTQAPVLSAAPADVTVSCDAIPDRADLTAIDNCDFAPIVTFTKTTTYSPDPSDIAHYNFTINRTWTATDACGNSSSKTQVVTVHDVTAPVITCPASVTVNCQDNNSSSATGVATAIDNCTDAANISITQTDVSTYSSDPSDVLHYTYTITRTWRATDVVGNYSECVQTITVQDVTAPVPVITDLPAITGECSVIVAAAPTAMDNCAGEIVGTTLDPVSYTAQGIYTITWTYTDVNGNTSTQTQTVIVKDVTAPVPVITDLPVINAQCSVTVNMIPSASGPSATPAPPAAESAPPKAESAPPAAATAPPKAESAPPAASSAPPAASSAPPPSAPPVTVPSTVVVDAPTAMDNCGATITATTADPLSYNSPGTYIIHWVFTDVNGNSSTQEQTVIILDVTAPVITCPGDVTVNCQDNNTSSATGVATATDNCTDAANIAITQSDVSTYSSDPSDVLHYTYTITRTWRATDVAGNYSECVQTITVQDVTAPVPVITDLPAITGECSVIVTAAPTAMDNCAGEIVGTTLDPVSYTAQGIYTITWTYSDVNGNTSTQTQTVIVKDVTAPVPVITDLPMIHAQCSVTVNMIPSASAPPAASSAPPAASSAPPAASSAPPAASSAPPAASSAPPPSAPPVTAPSTVVVDAPIAIDNCGETVTATTADPLSYNSPGTYIIHWIFTDVNGNSSTQEQTVIILDVTAPVITCPGDVTVNCQDNNTSSATGVATATDNCTDAANISITQSDVSTYSSDLSNVLHYNYVIARTWRATDAAGNFSECVQTITVQDVTAPIITCPGDINVNCQDNNTSANTGVATATDNCGDAANITITQSDESTYSADPSNALHYNYVITRTWRATDIAGNFSECVQTITVRDITAPVITCPGDVTVNCQDNNTSANTGVATASDNCGDAANIAITQTDLSSYSADPSNVLHYNYVIRRTWRATDIAGNFSECVQTITARDVTAPIITCPGDVTVNCHDNNTSANTGVATATDNCGDAANIAITQSDLSTYSADLSNVLHYNYVITRTWRATDVAHNFSECVQTITVQDATKPIITCPGDVTVNCQDDNSSSATGVATATDNCAGSANIAITQSDVSTYSSDPSNVLHYNYVITRTWRATDIAGNYSECVQTITVQDITKPVITCPGDVTVNCQDDNSSSATGVATATDNCAGSANIAITQSDASTYSSDPSNVLHYNYTITRTWKATDIAGNYSECVQTITVQDITKPVITCPGNVTVNCQDDNSSSATGVATATDNCAGSANIAITQSDASTYSSDPSNVLHYNYTITRTWKATDIAGNYSECVQTITVQDITKPVITCSGDVTVNCQDDNTSAATGVATATDNCAGSANIAITQSDASTYSSDPSNVLHYNYTITRTWKATDIAGNYSECVQTITVQDITKPVITCPGNITVNCQNNNSSSATGVATATDNCAGSANIAITQSDASTYSSDPSNVLHYNYVITRTWRATDVAHNYSECVQTITVQDVTKPVITCPGNVTVNCQDNNTSTATGVATATDNCAGSANIAITQSDVSTYSSDPSNVLHYNYVITRTWRATDVAHNFSECVQTITVQDVTKPVITCPGNITVNCQDNNTSAVTGVATATDNCVGAANIAITQSDVSTYSSDPSNVLHYNYVITRTWRATDVAHNFSECVQTITVRDITKPVITLPSAITLNCQDNTSPANTGTATGTDICSPVTITYSDVSTQVASLTSAAHYNYTITRTWTATDVTGNYISGVQTITVRDIAKPVITLPAAITLNCQDNSSPANTGTATGTDICSPVTITYSDVNTQVTSLTSAGHYNYTITRTWTAADATGNNISGVQIITVRDITKPVIVTCPSGLTQCNDQAGNIRSFNFVATDNCSPLTTSYTIVGPGGTVNGTGNTITTGFAVGTTTITWTVKDVSLNSNTCTTTVVINPLPVAGITAAGADAFCNGFVLSGSSTLTGPFTYQWLYNNQNAGTTQNITLGLANGDGVYTLFTTDVKGCRSATGAVYSYQKQNLVSSYTIIAEKEVDLGKYNKVASGSVGITSSKGEAEFKAYSSVNGAGSFVKAPKIDKDGSGIVISSQLIGIASVTLPVMQYNTVSTNNLPNYTASVNNATLTGSYKTLTVKKGISVTVTANTFGSIKLEEGASIRFTATVLNIADLVADKGAKNDAYTYIRFNQNTSVRVSGKVSIGSQVLVNPESNKVTFYMGDLNHDEEKFTVKGGDTRVIANIYMPDGKLRVTATDSDNDDHVNCDHKAHDARYCQHKNHDHNDCEHTAHSAASCNDDVYMTGLFIAEEVESKGNTVIWNSYDCSATAPAIIVNSVTPVMQSVTEKIQTTVSTEEELKVTVMPNPSTTYFTLKLESKYETPVNIRVMDGRGRVVDARSKIGANSTIQIGHNYSSGTYYAELIQGTKRKVVQLIKGKG